MNTLRELGVFVGIPQGSVNISRWYEDRTISLQSCARLINRSASGSMRELIETVTSLSPLTLTAEIKWEKENYDDIINPDNEPLPNTETAEVRTNQSGGICWWTTLLIYNEGFKDPGSREAENNKNENIFIVGFGHGNWTLKVQRAGISNTGFVFLEQNFPSHRILENPKPKSTIPKPPQSIPTITVESNGDGSFIVTGSGFEPKEALVVIRVDDGSFREFRLFNVTASEGKIEYKTGKICKSPGPLYFTATDGRLDEHSGQIFTRVVTVSCP